MNALPVPLLLLLAALLEVGGDALVRAGMRGEGAAARAGLIAAGAAALLAYALAVNGPAWDFGKSLGVYVALFFIAAQAVDFAAFGVRPDLPLVVGGALIVAGGAVITLWRV